MKTVPLVAGIGWFWEWRLSDDKTQLPSLIAGE
jgi:hypothetical protein